VIPLGSTPRCEYVKTLGDVGYQVIASVPVDADVCERAIEEYQRHIDELGRHLEFLAAAYTADVGMNEGPKRLRVHDGGALRCSSM